MTDKFGEIKDRHIGVRPYEFRGQMQGDIDWLVDEVSLLREVVKGILYATDDGLEIEPPFVKARDAMEGWGT